MDSEALAETRGMSGVHFLDALDAAWPKKTKRPVRVASTHDCPLAQLYGRYRAGCEKLGLTNEQALEFGFRADAKELGNDVRAIGHYYAQLDAIFNREIERRLELA
ncbi:hypothetical protein HY091_02635 [Candidatus Kaiserbacteria bacterium]|nr:hypothetical protein [Candidatus Kaiserbacteria bacterium]